MWYLSLVLLGSKVITGFSTKSLLPMEEEWCLYHPKHILRQEAQNNFYDTL